MEEARGEAWGRWGMGQEKGEEEEGGIYTIAAWFPLLAGSNL